MKLTFYDKLIVFSSKDLYSSIKFHKTKNKKKLTLFWEIDYCLTVRLFMIMGFCLIMFDNKLKCTLLMYKIY